MIEKQFVNKTLSRVKLKKYLKEIMGKAGLVDLELIKTPLVTRIILYVTRPGFAIGKGGKNIKMLSETLKKEYGIENPQVEIEPIKDARLNARVVADKMKSMIEAGQSWRSVAFKTARELQNANAQGFEIVLSGALGGKGARKRKHRIVEGYMKKVGEQTKLVDYAKAHAYTKIGAIGIKVRIIKPHVIFPDKINVEEKVKKMLEEKNMEEIKEKKEIEDAKEAIEEVKKETKKKNMEEKSKKEKTQDNKKEEKDTNAEKPSKDEKKEDERKKKKPKKEVEKK